MTAREQLVTALTAVIPRTWKLVPYQDNLDTLDRVTLVLKQSTISKAPAAPQGAHIVSYLLTLVTPETDAQKAELALDALVDELLFMLDGITWLTWDTATKVQFSDSNMAYDITVEALTRKAK
ncbi:hypothetical protein D6T64_05640 [Cryobacterium melibiosiphilum]|uniref:DUF3168 domain-containing protein n=1 Tax=Cryobacterium melibiosiphilum TaxID=995039 RepID=A0A3A5MI40_9MICO|nr:hypothetical protein [Cryobacterium melibiosiphilum]RJT89817.1 hypothetical protein D6T64_05640 [Cryobacterium melibiosiphilum]